MAFIFLGVLGNSQTQAADTHTLVGTNNCAIDTPALKNKVKYATYGATINLKGEFCINQAIEIKNKSALTIRGQGMGNTTLNLKPNHLDGFILSGVITDLLLEKFTIRGSATTGEANNGTKRQVGIKNNLYGATVTRGRFRNLEFDKLITGMDLNGSETSSIIDCEITHNYFHDIKGTVFLMIDNVPKWGTGYGIHSAEMKNLTISDNRFERTGRHAIYQSYNKEQSSGHVLIKNNVFIGHGSESDGSSAFGPTVQGNKYAAAVVIARSNNVTAAFNKFIDSRTVALSVEKSNIWAPSNVHLIANRFFAGKYPAPGDIWLENAANVIFWMNTNQSGNEPHCIDGPYGTRYRCNSSSPINDITDNGKFWAGTQAITEMDGYYYVMQNNMLHRVKPNYGQDPSTWSYTYSTTNWSGFQAMEVADNGALYIMQNNLLHKVTPGSHGTIWPYIYSIQNWSGFQAMKAVDNGTLFIMQNNYLHKVTPGSHGTYWPYIYSTTNWFNFSGLEAVNDDELYIMQNGLLHMVTPGPHGTYWNYDIR